MRGEDEGLAKARPFKCKEAVIRLDMGYHGYQAMPVVTEYSKWLVPCYFL